MCLHADYGFLNQECVDNLRLFSRWAVPFYFITTGFFIREKIEKNNLDFKRIQKNVSTLISILIVSSAIYILVNFVNGYFPIGIVSVLIGSHFHLWFIGSLLTGYVFIWYLFFIGKPHFLPYIYPFVFYFLRCSLILMTNYSI
jgi:surface polysaccharide O-acyltransferase-like enzyme